MRVSIASRAALAGVCGLLCAVAGSAQPKLPSRPPGSCIAPDTWAKLATQRLSKPRDVNSAAISLDGNTLVISIKDGVLSRLLAFDTTSSRMLWDHALDDPADLLTVAGDGSQIAARTGVHCKGVPLHHWDLRTGKDLSPFAQDNAFAGQVWPSTVAYGGNLIAASESMTGDIQIWNASSGQTVKTISANFAGLIGHQGLASLVLSTDGKQLLAGGSGMILRWQLPAATKLSDIGGFGSLPVTHLSISSDGKRLAVGTHAGVTILEPISAKMIQTLPAPWVPLRFNSKGTLLLASKTETGQWQSGQGFGVVKTLPAGTRRVLASSNGTLFGLLTDRPTGIQLLNLNSSNPPLKLTVPNR